jgi:hypothetical protein
MYSPRIHFSNFFCANVSIYLVEAHPPTARNRLDANGKILASCRFPRQEGNKRLVAAKSTQAPSKERFMSRPTHVLRVPASHRSLADPFAAILPEVAEPKLEDSLLDEDENLIPLRLASSPEVSKGWSFLLRLFRAKASR